MKNKQANSQNKKLSLQEVEKLLKIQEEHLILKLMQFRQGPTPSPEELQKLQEIDPSFPDRIISMAEKEQNFRHKATYIGQINFILLVILGYSIAGITSYFGSPVVGTTIAAGVSYIAYVFKTNNPQSPKKE